MIRWIWVPRCAGMAVTSIVSALPADATLPRRRARCPAQHPPAHAHRRSQESGDGRSPRRPL